MADLKISDMPDVGAIESSDQIPVVRAGENGRAQVGSAAAADTGTGGDDVPTNDDLGTAAQADTGTSPTEVPTNADLGDLAFQDLLDLAAQVSGLLALANLANLAALSILGRASNTSGVMAAITAANDGEVLRRNGTALAFGAINLALAAAVSGILDETNGGTGQNATAAGDLFYGASTNVIARLAVGRAGQKLSLASGPVPAWANDRLRNGVDNPAFAIWQRGTSFAAVANGAYTADRWKYEKSDAMVHTVSRSTDVPTLAQAGVVAPYSVLIDCTTVDAAIAAGDYCTYTQVIEGVNWADFAQKGLVKGFWVKATKTGTYCVALQSGGNDRSYVAEYTINAADTWEFKLVSFTASPSAGTWSYVEAGAGAKLIFTLAAGSTYQTTGDAWQTGNYFATANQVNGCDNTANDFRLALVDLNIGAWGGPFVADFESSLARCQRYYEKSFDYGTPPAVIATAGGNGAPWWMSPNRTDFVNMRMGSTFFKVTKRSAPTVTLYGQNNSGQVYDAGSGVDRVASASNVGQSSFGIAGSAVTISANTAFYYGWTAEADF